MKTSEWTSVGEGRLEGAEAERRGVRDDEATARGT